MPDLTFVQPTGTFNKDEPPQWRAECDVHQWAVADGNLEAVEALVREHTREHPSVHCPPPPALEWAIPKDRALRGKTQRFEWADGTVTHCVQCGKCRWAILHAADPVDAYLTEHWVVAHGS